MSSPKSKKRLNLFADEIADAENRKRAKKEKHGGGDAHFAPKVKTHFEENPVDLCGDVRVIKEIVLGEGAKLFHFALGAHELGTLHEDMKSERPDEYSYFMCMGKQTKHPRKIRAYLRSYKFSGRRHTAVSQLDTPLSLVSAMQAIEKVCRGSNEMSNAVFNSALVNWYANGNEYIAAHSDDERDLVAPPTVATLSLGQERVLRVRRKSDNAIVKDVTLKHGSVYIMHGARFQADYTHEVPQVRGKKGAKMDERISVTLRQHAK